MANRNVLTHQNNVHRTCEYLAETALTPANIVLHRREALRTYISGHVISSRRGATAPKPSCSRRET
jgi:hypothetical protein